MASMRQAPGRTRDASPRQLPTDHDCDGGPSGSIREYQSDQPSTKPLRPAPGPLQQPGARGKESRWTWKLNLTGRSISEAPFGGEPVELASLALRYGGGMWGADSLAMIGEWWWKTRRTRTWRVRPGAPEADPQLVFDRSWEDRYNDPGDPVLVPNGAGGRVIFSPDGGRSILLSGEGASPEGNRPFVDRRVEFTAHLFDHALQRRFRPRGIRQAIGPRLGIVSVDRPILAVRVTVQNRIRVDSSRRARRLLPRKEKNVKVKVPMHGNDVFEDFVHKFIVRPIALEPCTRLGIVQVRRAGVGRSAEDLAGNMMAPHTENDPFTIDTITPTILVALCIFLAPFLGSPAGIHLGAAPPPPRFPRERAGRSCQRIV